MIIFNRLFDLSVQKILILICISFSINTICLAKNNIPNRPLDYVSSYVCQHNNYVFNSHAKCKCFDENEKQGNGIDSSDASLNLIFGWSSCECPKIIQSKLDNDSAHNANFASLNCNELKKPSLKGTAFPLNKGHQSVGVEETMVLCLINSNTYEII